MKPKCACSADIQLDPVSGLLRVDNIPVFRLCRRGDGLFVQFQDGNKIRADGRGTNLVELPITEFLGCVARAGALFET
jgi:hypothetical protein